MGRTSPPIRTSNRMDHILKRERETLGMTNQSPLGGNETKRSHAAGSVIKRNNRDSNRLCPHAVHVQQHSYLVATLLHLMSHTDTAPNILEHSARSVRSADHR